MRQRLYLPSFLLAALLVAALAGTAAAQTGRVGGVVKDEAGNPIKGATVTAENPSASPSSFTATTDDKGRFSIIGLKSGQWSFAAQAPGFGPEAGKLNVSTIAAYNELLKVDPNSDKAIVGIGMTNLEKGDLKAAEDTLTRAAQGPKPTREVFYNLGEVKFAKGQTDEAAVWYQKAVDLDPTWGKPIFKLALVQLNKGDKDATIKMLEKVISADPTSQEAAQAKTVIEQLKK